MLDIICQVLLHINMRQQFPAVQVHVLIEARAQRAGPPLLSVPHNIILFSNSMWLVGYSEGHQKLSSSHLHRWNLAKLTENHLKLWNTEFFVSQGYGNIQEQFQNLNFPQTKHWFWLAGVVKLAAHRVLATPHEIIELFRRRRRKILKSSTC